MEFKKTILALMAIGATGVASAAMYSSGSAPASCSGGNVAVPCDSTAWSIGVQGLWVKPLADSLHYAWDDALDETLGNTSWTVHTAKPKWNWGIYVDAGYHFGPGSDVMVDWTHFKKKTERTMSGTEVISPVATPSNIDGALSNADTAKGTFDIRFDTVHASLAQMSHFGDRVNMHFHTGVRWARIKHIFTSRVYAASATTTYHEGVNDSRFSGTGPGAGLDASYDVGSGFSLVGKASTSLMLGNLKRSFVARSLVSGSEVRRSHVKESDQVLVPSIDSRVGIKYGHEFGPGMLSVDAGYQVAGYFGSVRRPVTEVRGNQDNTSVANNLNVATAVEKFGYHGAYFGLRWLGNV